MWSLFVMEIILNNPDKSTLQNIEKVMNITKEDPQYLANIIRVYVVGVEKTLDETLKLEKKGFSYSAVHSKGRHILKTTFETEKEQREKKQYKPLPPKKTKRKSLRRRII